MTDRRRHIPLTQIGGDIINTMKNILRFLHPVLSPLLLLLGIFAMIVLVAFVVLLMANFATVWHTLVVAGLMVSSTFCLTKWIIRVWLRYEDQRS